MPFIITLVVLSAIVYGVWMWSSHFFAHWHHGTFGTLAIFLTLVFGLIAIFTALMQLIKRLHDLRKPPYWTLLMLIPGVNVLFLLYAVAAPGKSE